MVLTVQVPENIASFLEVQTPEAWLDLATQRLPEMLLDHANCELKAASTALGFLYRYPNRTALAQRMSRLAREELRHFEQVRSIMDDMGIEFERMTASRYAGQLRDAARQDEPGKLLDLLLIGAIIEARSCERFVKIAPRLQRSWGNSTLVYWLQKLGILNTTSHSQEPSAIWTSRSSRIGFRNSRRSRPCSYQNRMPSSGFIQAVLARHSFQTRAIFVPSHDTALLKPVPQYDSGR